MFIQQLQQIFCDDLKTITMTCDRNGSKMQKKKKKKISTILNCCTIMVLKQQWRHVIHNGSKMQNERSTILNNYSKVFNYGLKTITENETCDRNESKRQKERSTMQA